MVMQPADQVQSSRRTLHQLGAQVGSESPAVRGVTDDGDSGVRRAADRFGHVGDDRDAARRTVEHLAGVAAGQGVVDHHPDREPVTVANQAGATLPSGSAKQPSARTMAGRPWRGGSSRNRM